MPTTDLTELDPPFYIIDVQKIRRRLTAFYEAFDDRFDEVELGYSYKTNYVPAMLRTIHETGAKAEVVSMLEYRLARRLGLDGTEIIFNGPNKTAEHVARALDEGATLNLDSLRELEHAIEWSRDNAETARIGLRVNIAHPEHRDHRAHSRFGMTDESLSRAAELVEDEDVEIVGLHAHLSTKSRDLPTFRALTDRLGEASKIVGADSLEYIDVGGGFGRAPDQLDLEFPSFEAYADCIGQRLSEYGLDDRQVITEPGIAMVGDAVSFYTDVQVTKQIDGRNVAFISGSIHNVKPTRHSHNLPTRVFDSNYEPKDEDSADKKPWDLVGYTCMDDDFVAVGQSLPDLQVDDILRIDNVGAYTLVFNPQFIRARPAIYTVEDDTYKLARHEESFDSFFADYVM